MTILNFITFKVDIITHFIYYKLLHIYYLLNLVFLPFKSLLLLILTLNGQCHYSRKCSTNKHNKVIYPAGLDRYHLQDSGSELPSPSVRLLGGV